jgi:hypothetical protein
MFFDFNYILTSYNNSQIGLIGQYTTYDTTYDMIFFNTYFFALFYVVYSYTISNIRQTMSYSGGVL